jgi:hypothetical protein
VVFWEFELTNLCSCGRVTGRGGRLECGGSRELGEVRGAGFAAVVGIGKRNEEDGTVV